jgi:hypothetical protein
LSLIYFFPHRQCSRQFVWTEKNVLARWADRNNRQRLHIPGLSNIFGPFSFEFSKTNVLKINLTKIFLIYASVNNIIILQRQFDDRSCFQRAQNLTKRIFLIKNRYFIFIEYRQWTKYSDASNILYILHIKQQFFKKLSWSQFMSDSVNFCVYNKSEFNVVLLYNFKIIFYGKHSVNTQDKHTTKLISFETQCNDSTFVDKLFKSVFISLLLVKHASKSYYKLLL